MQAGEDKCTGCERVLYDFEVIRVGIDKLCHVCAAKEAERCRDAVADAHAAGFAEAIENAAKVLDGLQAEQAKLGENEFQMRDWQSLAIRDDRVRMFSVAAASIRALVPASTTEGPK